MCKEKYLVNVLGLPAEEDMRDNGKNSGWMKSKREKSNKDYPTLHNHKPPYQMAWQLFAEYRISQKQILKLW